MLNMAVAVCRVVAGFVMLACFCVSAVILLLLWAATGQLDDAVSGAHSG